MRTLTSLQIATALYGHITDDVLGFLNAGTYAGTAAQVRPVLGTELVSVDTDGCLTDSVGGWVADRLADGGCISARESRRLNAAAS